MKFVAIEPEIDRIALSVVEALVETGLLAKENFEAAVQVVEEEITNRQAAGGY